jgi:hypothetical protein
MRARELSLGCIFLAWTFAACSDTGSSGTRPTSATSGSGGSGGSEVNSTGGSDVTGSGGAAMGNGGGDVSGTAGSDTTSGSGGSDIGGSGGSPGGTAGGSVSTGEFSRPKGTIPNVARPASMVNVPRANWKADLISPTMNDHHHHNQPTVVNGYLLLNGNEEFFFWDITDPANPKAISQFNTPNRCATCGGKGEGEAESHTVSFARYGDTFYEVTTSGKGVDIWNITDETKPAHVKSIALAGVNYGDFTDAVWGMYWQGDTIYIGSTNNGLDILDAHDPNNVTFVKRLPTSAYGSVSAGPVYAVGNTLVIMTPKSNGGIATLDISDPLNPVALDAIKMSNSYIAQFYRHYVFLQSPVRLWDVLSDPTTIGSPNAPISSLTTAKSEYMSFADDYLFLGHLRPDAGASKIDVSDPKNMHIVNRIWGRLDRTINDDQFTISVGNLLVMGDDQAPYYGSVIGVHQAEPDTRPPIVDTVIPKNGSTGQSTKSRVGITFSDNIELATVNAASVIVRPMGGEPLAGKWGLEMGVLNFDPDQDLQPKTTYEVILPKGGLTDLVGNALAEEFRSTFTTQ